MKKKMILIYDVNGLFSKHAAMAFEQLEDFDEECWHLFHCGTNYNCNQFPFHSGGTRPTIVHGW